MHPNLPLGISKRLFETLKDAYIAQIRIFSEDMIYF